MKKLLLVAIPLAFISYFGVYALLHYLPNTHAVLISAITLGVIVLLSPAWFGLRAQVHEVSGPMQEQQRSRVRVLEWRLILCSLASLGTLPLVYLWNKDMLIVWWVPLAMGLWGWCGVPLLKAKDPTRCDPLHPSSADREASLAPRERRNPVPPLAWAIVWGLVSWFVLVVIHVCLKSGMTENVEQALASVVVTVSLLCAGPYFSRWWILRPEPMRSAARESLEREYRRLRQIKSWWVYAFCFANAVFMLSQGLAFLWYVEHGSRSWMGTLTMFIIVLVNLVFGLSYGAQMQRISGFLKG